MFETVAMQETKMIQLDRYTRRRTNDQSIMATTWQQKHTKNLVKMLEAVNKVANHKLDAGLFTRFKAGEFSTAEPLWQSLNMQSKEFRLAGVGKSDTRCCCSHAIHMVWTVKHKDGECLRFGEDCINRIFPSFGLIKYRELIDALAEALEQDRLPMIEGGALQELFFQVNPEANTRFVTAYARQVASIRAGKPVVLTGAYRYFTIFLIAFVGLAEEYPPRLINYYIDQFNKGTNT